MSKLFALHTVAFDLLGPMNLHCFCDMILMEGESASEILRTTFGLQPVFVSSTDIFTGEHKEVEKLYNERKKNLWADLENRYR